MSEDDREPDLESEKEPQSDDESRGQSNGAGSNMSSDSSENGEDWQGGSELPRPAGTKHLFLVEIVSQATRFTKRVRKPVHHIRTLAGRTWIANGMPTKS